MLTYKGSGVLNSLINKLPFELHLPGYQYCGPGTNLKTRLAKGQVGINKLDSACREHDIAYSTHSTLENRHKADRVLENKAWERVRASDSNFGEKSAAWLVSNAMKAKRKLGMGMTRKPGIKNKKVAFRQALLNPLKHHGYGLNIKETVKAARAAVKEAGGRKKIRVPRVIPVPKTGGFLPLLLAGLAALGSLTGGAAAVAKSVNEAKAAQQKLEESKRHNQKMEAIALGKKGDGLYLKKFRSGLGLYIKKQLPKNC